MSLPSGDAVLGRALGSGLCRDDEAYGVGHGAGFAARGCVGLTCPSRLCVPGASNERSFARRRTGAETMRMGLADW